METLEIDGGTGTNDLPFALKPFRNSLYSLYINGGPHEVARRDHAVLAEPKKRQFFLKPFINSTLFNFFLLYKLFF